MALKLPTAKKQLRAFKLHHFSKVVSTAIAGVQGAEPAAEGGDEGDKIQMFSALIMLLIQSCVGGTSPRSSSAGAANHMSDELVPTSTSLSRTLSSDSGPTGFLRPAYAAAYHLVRSFLQRCQKREEGAEYRPLLQNLVDDLLASFLMPDWPAAETLLQTLCKVCQWVFDRAAFLSLWAVA